MAPAVGNNDADQGGGAGTSTSPEGAAGASGGASDVIAVELWRLPGDFFSLTPDEQWKAMENVIVKAELISEPRRPCKMTFTEEALAVSFFAVVLGLPLMLPIVTVTLLLTRSRLLVTWIVLVGVLGCHPMPRFKKWQRRNRLGVILAKYFTMTMVLDRRNPLFTEAGKRTVEEKPAEMPIVCLACPHGVLNFGAIVWCFFSRWICGLEQYTPSADVVKWVPGLRYLELPMHCISASRSSLKRALQERPRLRDDEGKPLDSRTVLRGGMVGIVPDGIAGIFRCKPGEDVLFIGKKRGLMRVCIEEGALIMGGWFSGTSEMFNIVVDPLGILEWMSRKLKVSLFLFYGRWYLPVPCRSPVTLFAHTVKCTKTPAPTNDEVEALHEEVYGGLVRVYEDMRHYAGYPDRRLVIQ